MRIKFMDLMEAFAFGYLIFHTFALMIFLFGFLFWLFLFGPDGLGFVPKPDTPETTTKISTNH